MPVDRIQAPSAGLNTVAAPDYIKATQAPVMKNLLPGRDGRADMRGPLVADNPLDASYINNPGTFWVAGDKVLTANTSAAFGTKYFTATLSGNATQNTLAGTLAPEIGRAHV